MLTMTAATMRRRHFTFPASPLFLVFLLSSCASSIVALASSPPPRTVLVTGGAGYIGSHTCLELINTPDNRYRVVVLDNLDNSSEESLKRVKELTKCGPDRLHFRQCDLRDKEGVKRGMFLGFQGESIILTFRVYSPFLVYFIHSVG